MFDWVSNTVEVTLDGDAPDQAAEAPEVPPSPAVHGKGLQMPTFLPQKANLSVTGETPPVARMTLQPKSAPGIKLAVRGAFAILAEPSYLPPVAHELQEINAEKKLAGAVVPATLAIVGKSWSTPLRFDWAIPVYSDSIKPGDRIQGYFAIDPLADSPLTLPQGEYAAYLLIGGHLFGPDIFQAP